MNVSAGGMIHVLGGVLVVVAMILALAWGVMPLLIRRGGRFLQDLLAKARRPRQPVHPEHKST